MRRYLWSNTVIGTDAPEYTGTNRDLLIGFLVALAVLLPVQLGYFLIGVEVSRWPSLVSLPVSIFLYSFSKFADYRARRYRLTRTVWRGIRFSMMGSGWDMRGARYLMGGAGCRDARPRLAVVDGCTRASQNGARRRSSPSWVGRSWRFVPSWL